MKDPATSTTTPGTEPADKEKDKDPKEGKRKKKKGDEDRTMVKNDSPHPELCMAANETWAINFASKHVDKRKGCCPRWFLNKYCFSNCKNKDSHVKASDIPPEVLTTMKTWLKLCREQN
jgi:hypothetical protein